MIVDPDFFDHWRTILFANGIDNDPAAPVYVLRLWAHCHSRRQWVFDNFPEEALKALCRYPGDASALGAAFVSSGYATRSGNRLEATGWSEHNGTLVAAWQNGKSGGRPKGKTQSKPSNNPAITQSKPSDNPHLTCSEAIGLGKGRELKIIAPPVLVPLEPDLYRQWAEGFNSIEGLKANPKAACNVKAWNAAVKGARKDANRRSCLDGCTEAIEAVRRSRGFLGGTWANFDFAWMFGKSKGKLHLTKILAGDYLDRERNASTVPDLAGQSYEEPSEVTR